MNIWDKFISLFNGGMRAYKVQDVKREARIGVTAKNFNDLLEKGCKKLKVVYNFTFIQYISILNYFAKNFIYSYRLVKMLRGKCVDLI